MKLPLIGKLFGKKEKDEAAGEAEVVDKGKKKEKSKPAPGDLRCPVCGAKAKHLIQEGDLYTCKLCGSEFQDAGGRKPVVRDVSEVTEMPAAGMDEEESGPEEFMSPGGISVPDQDDFAESKLDG